MIDSRILASGSSFDFSERVRFWLPLGLAFVVTCGAFLTDVTPLRGYDWLRMHFFYKASYLEMWSTGRLPQWNPFVMMGRPAVAEIEAAYFYPLNLVYLGGVGLGFFLSLWIHFALGLYGMTSLVRRLGCGEVAALFAGLIFILGAPLTGRLQSGQIQVFCSLCWLPCAVVAGMRLKERPGGRRMTELAVVMAMALLAGSPPMFWILIWAWMFWLVADAMVNPVRSWKTQLVWLVGAGILSILLVSLQVWPFFELVSQGNRSSSDPAYSLGWSMEAQSWWSLVQSRPAGKFFYWEYNLHAGVVGFVLAITGAALGGWRRVVPWGALALGFGLLSLGPVTPLLSTLVDYVPGWGAFRYPSRYAIITAFALAVLAGMGFDQLLVRLPRLSRLNGRSSVILMGVVFGVGVWELGRAYLERSVVYSDNISPRGEAQLVEHFAKTRPLTPGRPPERVLGPSWVVRENSGMLYGYSMVSGFANPALARVWLTLHENAGLVPDGSDPVNLTASFFAQSTTAYDGLALDMIWNPETEEFFRPLEPNPRAWLESTLPGGVVKIEWFEADRIELTIDAAEAGTVVLAEPWYPGWSAKVDGVPVAVKTAHGWMRSFEVTAGSHDAVFTYRNKWWVRGVVVSMLAVLMAAGLWWRDDGYRGEQA